MMKPENRLLSRVAYQYYIQGKTQYDISVGMNLGRSTVSRLLTQARRDGIVEINIKGFDEGLLALEAKVKTKYGLRDVDIVPSDLMATPSEKDQALAQESAQFLRNVIKPNDRVGLAWGTVLAAIVGQLDRPKATKATFIPLVGGPSAANAKYHVNTIVYDLARQFGGTSIFINATAVQENQYLRDGIMGAKYFQELANDWQHLDIAFVGVGGPLTDKTSSHWRDLLTANDVTLLKEQHAIGDCCCTFFDKEGNLLVPGLQKRTIAIELETLAKVPLSVAVARSVNKVPSIKALLNMHTVNTLITDEETAQHLL